LIDGHGAFEYVINSYWHMVVGGGYAGESCEASLMRYGIIYK